MSHITFAAVFPFDTEMRSGKLTTDKQLAILSWDALDERSWPGVTELEPADIARVLGVYAQRVITPRGSTAVSGTWS